MTHKPNNFSPDEELTLELAIQICARDLPEFYNIEFNVENGSACMILYDDQRDKIWNDFELDWRDINLAERYLIALDFALKRHKVNEVTREMRN